MAIAVIGGLITSTLLSLVVVPVVFTYVHWWKLLLLRLVARKPEPIAPLPAAPNQPGPTWAEGTTPLRKRSAR